MKNILLAAVAATGLFVSTAAHAVLVISVFDNGVELGTTAPSSDGSAVFTDTSDPAFSLISVLANGSPTLPGADLSTVVLASSSATAVGTHTLTVDAFQTGKFLLNTESTFTVDNLIGDLGPTTESVLVNIAFVPPLGILLDTATFPAGTKTSTVGPLPSGILPAAPSDVNEFVISFTQPDQSINDTIDLATSTPEPSTWAMVLAGFAGLCWLARTRGRKNSPA
jgi:hypothetical protein